MSFNRICAVFLRYFYPLKRLDSLSDIVFWPLIDIFLWGLTSVWLQNGQHSIGHVAMSLMCGLMFWHIIWRTQYDVCVNLLQDLWARNLTNVFSSPLKLSEWILGVMLLGVAKAVFSVIFAGGVIYLLYALNVFTIGWSILPFFFLLCVAGWTMGFFSAGILMCFGQRLQQIAWMAPWVIAPFSAIFYPLDSLPVWAQSIGKYVPTTPFFQEMRQMMNGKPFAFSNLLIPALLNLFYLSLSILFFTYMFRKRKEKGLMGLE